MGSQIKIQVIILRCYRTLNLDPVTSLIPCAKKQLGLSVTPTLKLKISPEINVRVAMERMKEIPKTPLLKKCLTEKLKNFPRRESTM